MTGSRLDERIEALRQRVTDLRDRAARNPGALAEMFPETLEDLGESLEGLILAGRDLRRQHEQGIRDRQSLLEQTRLQDAFLEHTLTPTVFLDRHFNFLRVNRAYAKACGREVEDFPGHNHFEFYPHAENQAIFQKVVDTRTSFVVQAKPFSFPDHPEWGVTYWDWTLVPILDAGGEVDFLVFSLMDVTERERSEDMLRGLAHDLAQRVKELNTLNSVLALFAAHDVSFDQKLANLVQILPSGWEHPEVAVVRVQLDGKTFASERFRVTPWRLSTEIPARGRSAGLLELCYLEDRSGDSQEIFLPQESELLESVGRVVGEAAERRGADEALRASNTLLENVFSSIHLLVAYLDADFNFIRVNRSYAAADGRDEEFFPGKNHFHLYPNPDNEAIFRRVVTTGLPYYAFEKPFEGAGDSTQVVSYWDWSLLPVTDSEGKVTGVVLSLLDVTERRQAQVALRESEVRYRTLMEQASEGILLFDRFGMAVDANSRFCQMLDRTREDTVGRDIRSFVHPEDVLTKPFVWDRVLAGETVVNQRRLLRKDGSAVPVETSTKLLPDGFIQSIIHDVSERIANEERLRSYQAQLQSMASELSLIEERQRRQIAVDLHDRIGQSLAVSNMKLGAIRTACQAPDLTPHIDEVRALIEESIRETRSLIFDLSPPILYDLGLAPAVEWLADDIQARLGLNVSVSSVGAVVSLSDDLRGVLFRAVRELLTNAAKHSQASQASVVISRCEDSMSISVTDDGVGFDPTVLEKRSGSGFGLLSIRERLQYLGGSMQVDTSPGRGTRVTLTAPVRSDRIVPGETQP